MPPRPPRLPLPPSPGGPEFVYQSCTQIQEVEGSSMEGHFTFVEGSLQEPAGPEFEVECKQFRLDVPSIIF